MNKSLIAVIGVLTFGVALPSFAGPDWFVIEQGRKAKQDGRSARQVDNSAAKDRCTLAALAAPLDHGPRAQITPHEGRLLQQEQTRTCA